MLPDELAPGASLGDWTIERKLGEGGMALVYLARFERLARLDVLKVMRPWLAADPSFRRRFAAEAQLMCDWRHPHVVTVYDHREQDGLLYIAMQYVPHGDLRSVLTRDGRLPVERALAVVVQLADALDSGHEQGLVHRDVKPDNVLLQRWQPGRDHVLLSDFGISRSAAAETHLTQTGQLLLSPAYAAPEQWSGEPVDGRSDQYALGCLLHEMLTGEPPFRGGPATSLARAHLVEPPPRLPAELGLPPALDDVLARALAKRPDQRFASCGDLAGAAANAARQPMGTPPGSGRPGPTQPGPPGRTQPVPTQLGPSPGPSPRSSSRRTVVLAVALSVLGLLALIAGLVWAVNADDQPVARSVTLPRPSFTIASPPSTNPAAARALAASYDEIAKDCTEIPVEDPVERDDARVRIRCEAVDPGVDELVLTEWRSPSALERQISHIIAAERLPKGACSGGAQAWQEWRYGDAGSGASESGSPSPSASPSGSPVGTLACFTDERGRAVVAWTIDDDRVLLTGARDDGDQAETNDWWAR